LHRQQQDDADDDPDDDDDASKDSVTLRFLEAPSSPSTPLAVGNPLLG
jgi:hypothetical protein